MFSFSWLLFYRVALSRNDLVFDRKLGACLAERLASFGLWDTVDLKEDTARLYLETISLWISFALTHTHFCSLLRVWHIRENAYPDLAGLACVASDDLAGRLELV